MIKTLITENRGGVQVEGVRGNETASQATGG